MLHTCLGLSKYDMNTVFYYILTVVLCLVFNILIYRRQFFPRDITLLSLMVFGTFSNVLMYVLGFLAGIIMARTTAIENLESLTEIKLDPAVKPGAVGSITPPLSII